MLLRWSLLADAVGAAPSGHVGAVVVAHGNHLHEIVTGAVPLALVAGLLLVAHRRSLAEQPVPGRPARPGAHPDAATDGEAQMEHRG